MHTTLFQHWSTALEKLVLESLGVTDDGVRLQLHFCLLGGVIEGSELSISGKPLTIPTSTEVCVEEV